MDSNPTTPATPHHSLLSPISLPALNITPAPTPTVPTIGPKHGPLSVPPEVRKYVFEKCFPGGFHSKNEDFACNESDYDGKINHWKREKWSSQCKAERNEEKRKKKEKKK